MPWAVSVSTCLAYQLRPRLTCIDYSHNSGLQYLPASYESPETNQNDLAALPNGYGSEYDDNYVFASVQPNDYTSVSLPPSATGSYSTVPPPISAPVSAVTYIGPITKKRKASVESFHSDAPAAKRINHQDPSGEYYEVNSEASPYSSFVPTPTTMAQLPYQITASPRVHGHHHSTSNVSQISVAATAPYTPTVSPSFTTANTEHSPHAPATPGARPSSAASNPRLVRTSTLPNHSPQTVPSSNILVGHTQNFNPYTLYSPDSKARLHLDGNLDDVAKKWSEDELEVRRKIVVFDREQKGNDIYASFKVVSQQDWKNHPRSVSCIWWAEKKEAYVTSVDTILLLEGIVAARFTVEEKNRIRRNLEGFKPDTVSKAKPDTEEFFKVIMGFPNPKPRNIEKDVKVFPWKVLSIALQKIISKYSASYASTAASIQHQPKMYRPLEHHEYPYSASSAQDYHGSVQLANFPVYETQGRLSAPPTPAPHMHLATHMPYSHEAHAGYNYNHAYPAQSSHVHYQPAPMTAPVSGPAYWHEHGYSATTHAPMGTASAPPSAYPRELIEANYHHRAGPMNHYVHAGHH